MGDSVWIRTEGGNWYPGKVSSNNVKRGLTRQVLNFSIRLNQAAIIAWLSFTERGVILSRDIPHWYTHQETFRTIKWGNKTGYVTNTYIASPCWVVVVVVSLLAVEYCIENVI